MGIAEHISDLELGRVEDIERLTTRWLFQAALDFGFDAFDIFLSSPDAIQDIAEDITRELLDRLPGYNIPQRVFGTVDYKKARYVILPDQTVRQALLVDSKAEKDKRNATIQMSQTSMVIRHQRRGRDMEVQGGLLKISEYGGHQYLTTTALLHFYYEDIEAQHHLQNLTVCCIPSGILQDTYNPSVQDGFWKAGRNAPTRGEVFRVRIDFRALKAKCKWRVQSIRYDESTRTCHGTWDQ